MMDLLLWAAVFWSTEHICNHLGDSNTAQQKSKREPPSWLLIADLIHSVTAWFTLSSVTKDSERVVDLHLSYHLACCACIVFFSQKTKYNLALTTYILFCGMSAAVWVAIELLHQNDAQWYELCIGFSLTNADLLTAPVPW